MPSEGYQVSALSEVLKETYPPELLADIYKEDHVLFKMFMEGDKGRIRGRNIHIPFRTGRNPSGGAGGEWDAFPRVGVPTWDHYSPKMTFYRNRFLISTAAQDDSQGNASFVQTAEQALTDCIEGIKSKMALDMFGNRYGVLATIALESPGGTATLILNNSFESVGAASHSIMNERGARNLMVNQYINVVNPADVGTKRVLNGAAATAAKVVSRDNTGQITILCDPAGNIAAKAVSLDDWVVRENGASASPIGHSIYGLDEIIDDGSFIPATLFADYGGVDRTLLPQIDSHVVDISAAGVTSLAYEDLEDAIEVGVSMTGEAPTPENFILMMHTSVRNQIRNWDRDKIIHAPMEANLGISNKDAKYNPGYGEFPFYTDRMCPVRTLFGVKRSEIQVYENIPISWDDSDGGLLKIHRDANGVYDAHEGFLRARIQMFSEMPHAHFKLCNMGNTRADFGKDVSTFVFPTPT
jgi:hypothetical protein